MAAKTGEFQKNSILLFGITLFASGLNYLFQILVGQALPPADFGIVNTLLSLTNIISIPASLMAVLSSKYTAHYLSLQQPGTVSCILRRLLKISAFVGLGILAAGGLCSVPLARALRLENAWLVFFAFAAVFGSCTAYVFLSALQGAKRFLAYGVGNIIISAAKLVFSLVFIWLGFQVFGVLLAVLLGFVFLFLFSWFSLRGLLRTPPAAGFSFSRARLARYASGVFTVHACLALLSYGDMLLVKAFIEDPAAAGLYASGAVIGKIPIYLVSAIVSVLFPLVAERVAQNQSTLGLLAKGLLYGGLPAAAFSAFLVLFGRPVVRLLFGEAYAGAAALFFPICCFTLMAALLTVEIHYFLALGKTLALAASLLAGFAAILLLVTRWHHTIGQMLYIMGGALLAVFVFNLFFAVKYSRQSSKREGAA